jgi:phosphatidylserine/phosphatidylglycerophosphate/cardiolipin synthase-like enzyme
MAGGNFQRTVRRCGSLSNVRRKTAWTYSGGPDLRPEAIHQLLLTAIYAAQHELIMTTPYTEGLLHTKSLTIDDDMSVFGSVNLELNKAIKTCCPKRQLYGALPFLLAS